MYLIAKEGPQLNLLFDLKEGDEWIIGRDPDEAEFILEDDTVSRKHARLIRKKDGIYLENLSLVNPILVNEAPIEESTLLKEGDKIQIGRTTFVFSEKEAEETPKKIKGGYDDIFESIETPSEEPKEEIKEKKKKKEESHANAYDTIFEEAGEEEAPIPLSFLPEAPFLLKVITGPNAGAEIGIEKGRSYTIGKDAESCDIVFQDLSVSRNHARLCISQDGEMDVEDLGSKNGTALNGTPLTEKKSISPQDMVTLGTTSFIIVDREAPQETIYSPMTPIYEAPKEEALPPAEEAIAIKEEEKRDWKKEPIPSKFLIAAISFAAIFLIVFLSFFSLFKTKEVQIAKKEPTSHIEKAIAKFEGVQFSFNPASGKLFLVGHVLTAVEAQEMRFKIGEIDFINSVEDNVVIDEYVDKSMNDVLSSNPVFRGVVIQSPKAGKFFAMGYVETNETAAELGEYLTINFPYLDRLENRVVVGENLSAEVQALLQSKGFGMLAFQYSNGEVILTGNYSDKMEDSFKSLLEQIHTIKGVATIKNYAVATLPNAAAIDLSGQYQVTGISQYDGKGYSAILNGKIYTLGDVVSGMAIQEIDPNTILLEKDGIKYKINYTR